MMWRYSRYRIGKNTHFSIAKRKGKFSLLRLSFGFYTHSLAMNEKNAMNLIFCDDIIALQMFLISPLLVNL